eukprot:414241_1
MSLDFKRIKDANRKSTHVVDGYIRILQRSLSSHSLYHDSTPQIINHICLCFYYQYDEFDETCIAGCLTLLGNTLTHSASSVQGSALLKNVISEGQHHWRFKLGRCSNWTLIGLWKPKNKSKRALDLNTYFTDGGESYGYAYISCNGRLASLDSGDWAGNSREYGPFKPKEGDTVEMCVNFDTLELRYIVNGQDFGVAFKIEKTEYRAAVNMYYQDDSITLLDDV